MDIMIGLVIVGVIAILVIRRAKPELYARIKNSISAWF